MLRVPTSLAALVLAASACGADVTVNEGGNSQSSATPVDLCACWAARALETPISGQQSCSACWLKTIFWDPDASVAACHFDQSRCLADAGCEKALNCVQQCKDAPCVNQCITKVSPDMSRDLFLDWSRCFCMECHDACPGPSTAGDCPAGS